MLPVTEKRAACKRLRAAAGRARLSGDRQLQLRRPAAGKSIFAATCDPVALANPIASQMSVMRSSLIGSLVDCVAVQREPASRSACGCSRSGAAFCARGGGYRAADGGWADGLRRGSARAMGQRRHARVDFYDVKADVEALLAPRIVRVSSRGCIRRFIPGKSARIVMRGHACGWLGELHPRWQQKYDLPFAPVVFELDLDVDSRRALAGAIRSFHAIPAGAARHRGRCSTKALTRERSGACSMR